MIGIYGIRNTTSGRTYIGKSNCIRRRFCVHKRDLRLGTHYNRHLQHAWDRYGEYNFEFVVLEECSEDELSLTEQKWVDAVTDKYNYILDVVKHSGTTNPFFGKKHTDETKKKMSEAKKGKYRGSDNPNFGRKQSVEVRLRMGCNNSRTLLDSEKVLSIVEMLKNGDSHEEIANRFSVSRSVITRISTGKRWTNVTGGAIFPTKYKDGKRVLNESHKKRIGERHKGMKYKKGNEI